MQKRSNFHTFLAVYRTGSQTKAAQELSLTQPAISQQIKDLEHYIGRLLFKQKGKYLEPTATAHQLAFSIRDPMNALDTVWENFKSTHKSSGGTVYLGGIAEFFATVVAPALASLNKHNIQIHFEIGHDILLEKLLEGELDMAQFCVHITHPGITIERFFHEQYYLVGSPKWAKRIKTSTLNKGDTTILDELPWVAYDESLLFIKEYYQTIFNKSFTGKVVLMIKDLWSIEAAVVGGLGITVLPSYFCQKYLKTNKLILIHKTKVYPNHYFYLGYKDGALHNPRLNMVRQLLLQASSKKSL